MTVNQLLENISKFARAKEVEIYPVGGFVRDHILNIDSKDIDFVVIGDGIAFAKQLIIKLAGKNLSIFKTFGTAHFSIRDYELEFVAARKESYSKDSRKPVVEKTDLKTDLSRRDFTINAMAMHIDQTKFGQVIDPFNGQSDIKKGIIRTPLDPDIAFDDDPLRILRAIRFATRFKFEIDSKTFSSIIKHVERLQIVSMERITDELKKILESEHAHIGLTLLYKSQIMQFILPELEHKMKNLIRFLKIHKKQTIRFQEFLAVALAISNVQIKEIKYITKRLKLSNEINRFIVLYISNFKECISLLTEKISSSKIKVFLYNTGSEYKTLIKLTSHWLETLNKFHHFSDLFERIEHVNKNNQFSNFKLDINGFDISNCLSVQGVTVGRIKSTLIQLVLDETLKNEKSELISYLIKHENELK